MSSDQQSALLPHRRLRSAVLFMPGDDLHKIQTGASLGVDSVVMDLEDGVALNRKAAARNVVCEALQTIDFGPTERLIRLNTSVSGLEHDDLFQTVSAHPDGYVLPKVESAEAIRSVSHWLAQIEERHNWEVGAIRLLAVVETARGIMNLNEIAAADGRLRALIFGAEDLAGDIGATRSKEGWEIFYGRSAVVLAARAHDLQAIDTVYVAFNDDDGLREDARRALQMGYDGKLAIHPRQVPIIHDAFTPNAEEIAHARALMQIFEEHQRNGTGAFEFYGKMVDMPMLRAAQRILQRAGFSSQ